MDLGNGFARHARLQKAADAAVLVASYVYDENHPAEMYRVAEQYLQANLDNEEDRALSLDEIRKKYDMKLYGRKAQDSTKTAGVLLTLDATEKIGSKFIEFVGIHGFSVDVRATTKVVVKKQSRDSGVLDTLLFVAIRERLPRLETYGIGKLRKDLRLRYSIISTKLLEKYTRMAILVSMASTKNFPVGLSLKILLLLLIMMRNCGRAVVKRTGRIRIISL